MDTRGAKRKGGTKAGCFFCKSPKECTLLPFQHKARIASVISKTLQCPGREDVLVNAVFCPGCLKDIGKMMEFQRELINTQAQLKVLKESYGKKLGLLGSSLVSDVASIEHTKLEENRMLVLESIENKGSKAEAQPHNATKTTADNNRVVHDTPLVLVTAYLGQSDDSSDLESFSDSSESSNEGEKAGSQDLKDSEDLQPNDELELDEVEIKDEFEDGVPVPGKKCRLPTIDVPAPSAAFKKFKSRYKLRHCYVPLNKCYTTEEIVKDWKKCIIKGCTETFESKDERNMHIMNFHLNIYGPYKCPECPSQFFTKYSYEKHKKAHAFNNVCKECGKDCKIRSELFTHMKQHLDSEATIDTDPQLCPCTSNNISVEGVEVAMDSILCPDCGKEFLYEECLLAHIREVHSAAIDTRRKRLDPKWYPCSCCSKEMIRFEDPPNNLTSFDCLVCKRKFTKSEHTNREGELSILCDHLTCPCKERYADFQEFYLHHESICPKTYQKEACSCSTCGKQFLSQRCLVSHKFNTHSSDQPYRCPLCEKGFWTRKLLASHAQVHGPGRKYPCAICGRIFKNANNLKCHREAVHAVTRDYKCDVCSKDFTTLTLFKRHMDTHRPKDLPCPICGKMFKHLIQLKTHINVHEKRRAMKNMETEEGMGEEEDSQ